MRKLNFFLAGALLAVCVTVGGLGGRNTRAQAAGTQ